MNNLQIEFYRIISLSTYIIPNLANITLPFILIFGLLLTFIKLDKDKEIITIYSLGLSLKQITKPLLLTSVFFVIFYLLLNFFLSPLIYEKYKKKEFELRNIININNINYSNFLELNNDLIVDFEKDGKFFKDIYINYKDESGDNIIYSKKGIIKTENNNYIFILSEGNKVNIKANEIENLEFENYKINFPNDSKKEYDNFDKNTDTIFKLLEKKDYKNISERIFDTLLLIIILIFFFIYLIKKNNFNFNSVIKYLIITITILILQNTIKNLQIEMMSSIVLNLLNLSIILVFLTFEKIRTK
tara:strand:- start:238 stop:1143 length:906 start_codon:yes stop_codon:yes gene_type:complete